MKIQWLGHSAFRLEESTGTVIVTDPYHEDIVGYSMDFTECDAVALSHDHKDHNNLDAVSKDAIVIGDIGAYEIKGVHILGIRSSHGYKSVKRGDNIIYKFRMDGVEICHMGDIGAPCNVETLEAIGSCNILLIPIGGKYTIDAEEAKVYVDQIMPDIVIPMHYKDKKSILDIDKLDQFLRLFEDEDIIESDRDQMDFDRTDFDGETTKVLVFNR